MGTTISGIHFPFDKAQIFKYSLVYQKLDREEEYLLGSFVVER